MSTSRGRRNGAGARYALRVGGLSCPSCAYGIGKGLRRVAGARDIHTDVARGTAELALPGAGSAPEARIREAVEQAVLSLRGLERAGPGEGG